VATRAEEAAGMLLNAAAETGEAGMTGALLMAGT